MMARVNSCREIPLSRRGDRDARLPRPGTILTRRFEDRIITVEVLENGFRYEGEVYRSLSAVARKISGTQWNGFLFFASALNAIGRKAGREPLSGFPVVESRICYRRSRRPYL